MANVYEIYLTNDEIVSVDKRKMSIRDGCVHANGPIIGGNRQASLIIPLSSIKYIQEMLLPDAEPKPDEGQNIKMWKFGDLPPQS